MTPRNIHALLVGVETYQSGYKALPGSATDVVGIAQCLKHLSTDTLKLVPPQLLRNEEATRSEIIQQFHTTLINQAQEKDVCVFFFSGHGGQEHAPAPLASYEVDGKLEGIVCYDSGQPGIPKLIDKELRYLIHLLAQKNCDIITLFDCCHSGDNSRLELDPQWTERWVETDRSASYTWEDMILQPDHPLKDLSVLEQHTLQEVLPQGRHVHLAACLDFESAYEGVTDNKRQGFFTHALLECLHNSKGPVSYIELQRRIQHRLYTRGLSQTPQIYAPKAYQQEIYRAFLYGDHLEVPLYGNIRYDGYKRYWSMDLGGIHGISSMKQDDGNRFWIDLGNDKWEAAAVDRIFTGHSSICFPRSEFTSILPLSKEASYKAFIDGLLMDRLQLYIEGDSTGVAHIEAFIEQHPDLVAANQLNPVAEREAASFVLQAVDGLYQLTQPHHNKPLIRQVEGYSSASARQVFEQLKQIARWKFVKQLTNPDPTWMERAPIEMELQFKGQEPITARGDYDVVHLTHGKPEPGATPLMFRIAFTNTSSQPLYLGCLYLDRLYGVNTGYLQPNVVQLEGQTGTNRTIFADEGNPIHLEMPQHIIDFNWPEEVVYFKLIAGTRPFDIDIFSMPPLDAPIATPQDPTRGMTLGSRSDWGDEWTTQLFEFRLQNPVYRW